MNGFEWHSIRGFESLGFVKALRTLLTRHIPVLLPKIDTLIRMRIGEFYTAHPGPVQADGMSYPWFSTFQSLLQSTRDT